jgi:anti-repressor protein
MNDLIQITKTKINDAEVNSVNLRQVHKMLESKRQYADYAKGRLGRFVENEDYICISQKSEIGNRPLIEYFVTIDTAKMIAMMENNEKGDKVRKYFVQCEKDLNKPLSFEEIAKQTILLADKKIKELEAKIETDKPKVNFANAITGTISNIDFETFAKALYDTEGIKMGRNKLMAWFRANGYLMKNNKPYQAMLDRGLMTLKEGSYINQATQELVTYTQPRITGKGQMYFTNKLLDEVQNGN